MDDGLPDAVADDLTPTQRFGVREVLLLLAVALVAVPFAFLVYEVRRRSALVDADLSVARWLHMHVRGNRPLTVTMKALSFVGTGVFLFLVVALTAAWFARHNARKRAVFLIVTSIGGSALNSLVKLAVGRARPVFADPITHAFGKSFPSGHATTSFICYGAVVVAVLPFVAPRVRRPLVVAAAVLVVGIGFSRLALGVHFLSDVLGGYVLGAAWLMGSVAVFNVWRQEDDLAN